MADVLMASVWKGADCLAQNVPVHFSIKGVALALAKLVDRAEYRRIYRGVSPQRTTKHITGKGTATYALVETANDDGSRGATYLLIAGEDA